MEGRVGLVTRAFARYQKTGGATVARPMRDGAGAGEGTAVAVEPGPTLHALRLREVALGKIAGSLAVAQRLGQKCRLTEKGEADHAAPRRTTSAALLPPKPLAVSTAVAPSLTGDGSRRGWCVSAGSG